MPSTYLAAGHLDHGYATTVHKAQGATCDEAFVLGSDQLHLDAGYVAFSRGRDSNRLYIVDNDPHDEHHTTNPRTASTPFAAGSAEATPKHLCTTG